MVAVVAGQSPSIGKIQSRTAPATFRLAFHFVTGPNSSDFTLDKSAEQELLRADVLVYYLLKEMNERYSNAVIGATGSNRIRLYNRLERIRVRENNWWGIARVISHKAGHTQGLDHTFRCDNPCGGTDLDVRAECFSECATNNSGSVGDTNCFGASKRELMMGYGSRVYLTDCETELLWKCLLANCQLWVYYGNEVGDAPW